MTDQQRNELDTYWDHLHATGLAHLDLLAETAKGLRAQMPDANTQEDMFAYTHHLLAVSQAMLQWSRYLIPKEEAQEREERCEECEAEDEEDHE